MADNKELAEPLSMVHELKLVYDRVRAIGFDSDEPRAATLDFNITGSLVTQANNMLDQYKGLRDSVIHRNRIQTIFKDLVHNVLAKNVPDVEQLGETNDNEESRDEIGSSRCAN